MLLILFVAAFHFAGYAVSEWLWTRADEAGERAGPLERLASALVIYLALMVAANWVLAWAGLLGKGGLTASALFAAGGGALALRATALRLKANPEAAERALPRALASFVRDIPDGARVALVPLAAWGVVAAVLGWALPPRDADALAYHLTKAALLVKEGGFALFPAADFRVTYFPANFELLLSNYLTLGGTDVVVEWLSLGAWLMFAVTAGALAERWWGKGWHALAVLLVAAGAPVVVLHSLALKNDLLTCAFVLSSILWAGRWIGHGGRLAPALSVVALGLALGTKLQAGFLVIALVPAVAYGLWRNRGEWSLKGGAVFVAFGVTAFLLLGGWAYVENVLATGKLTGVTFARDTDPNYHGYGAWSHLWKFPVLLLLVPMSMNHNAVWAPWDTELFYWPHWNVYFSHFGGLFTFLVFALPFCFLYFRRVKLLPGSGVERGVTTLVALAAALLILPIQLFPKTAIAFYPRFVVFLVPVVAAWTVAPLVRKLARGWGDIPSWAAVALVGLLSGIFVLHAYHATFSSGSDVLGAAVSALREGKPIRSFAVGQDEEGREQRKATDIVAQIAGPNDHVALDVDAEAWTFLAFGPELKRKVTFIQPGVSGVESLSDDVDWVVVDRSWNVLWGHTAFEEFTEMEHYFGKGWPRGADTATVDAMEQNDAFTRVYFDPELNQAVFHRLSAQGEFFEKKNLAGAGD